MVFLGTSDRSLLRERLRPRPTTFKFNPFADEDEAVADAEVERMLDFIYVYDEPPSSRDTSKLVIARPKKVELHHPRPVRRVAIQDALTRFEEIANQPELQHPRPVRKVAIRDALVRFEEMVQSSDALPEFRNAGARVCASYEPTPSQFPADDIELFSSIAHDEATASTPLRPSGGLACLSPGFLEHFPGYQRGQPPRPTFVLNEGQVNSSTPLTSPTSVSPTQSAGGERADEQGDEAWANDHVSIEKSFGSITDSNSSWIAEWEAGEHISLDFERYDLANESTRSVKLDDYFGDDESSGGEESSSSAWSASPIGSPISFLPQPVSPDLFPPGIPTIRIVPRQSPNPEDDELNAPLTEEGVDGATLLRRRWMRMADEAARSNFSIPA